MTPLAHSNSYLGDNLTIVAKARLHSPPRSPRRPTMGILKNKPIPMDELKSPKKSTKNQQHSLLNEVRESLTMPKCGSSYSDDSEVCDDDAVEGENIAPITGGRYRNQTPNVDAIVSKGQRHSTATRIKPSRPVQPEQAPEPMKKTVRKSSVSDDRSVGAESTKSTKSTRSIRSFFRKQKPNSSTKASSAVGDDVSVASTKSGWWKRSSIIPEKTKRSSKVESAVPVKKDSSTRSGLRSIQSLRVKKPEKANVRGVVKNNDQLVADFFDVQSFASEPDFVGSARLRKTFLNENPQHGNVKTKNNRVLETSSVVSNRSQRSNIFSKFFQRMRAINDEVLDIDDDDYAPDLTGIMLNNDENSSVVDDELTLCSGFDSFSHMSSVQDEDDDDDQSRCSIDSNKSNSSNGSSGEYKNVQRNKLVSAPADHSETAPETPFIHKIMQRRILKNEATVLRDVVGLGNLVNSGPESDSNGKIQNYIASPTNEKTKLSIHGSVIITPQQQQRLISPMNRNKRLSPHRNLDSPTQRSKALAQSGMKLQSSKSMSHLPSSVEPVFDDAASPGVTRGLCRWNSDISLNSDPSAPKRPTRGSLGGGHDDAHRRGLLSTPSPSARYSPKKNLDKLIKTSQSMRNLSSPYDSKTGSDEDDDDDSILSLLSGLLASWSAERDNITISQRLPSVFDSGVGPKSILKLPSNESEEQKVDYRERYSVRFNAIEVREYERIVGDNPSCSKGPPISIGWGYIVHRHYPINDYEHLVRGPRRTKKEFHLAADHRTNLLINEWKCSEEDIRKARREATYIQYCRAKTAFSGSRAAAKEAAFLRKANDRSKVVVPPKLVMSTSNDTNASLPKIPSRRKTMDISPPTPTNRPIPSTPVKGVSASLRQKLLEV